MMRRFELHRDTGVVGGSRTGVVAEGVAFLNGLGEAGPAVVHYPSLPPLVFDSGVQSVADQHDGRAHLVWLDD